MMKSLKLVLLLFFVAQLSACSGSAPIDDVIDENLVFEEESTLSDDDDDFEDDDFIEEGDEDFAEDDFDDEDFSDEDVSEDDFAEGDETDVDLDDEDLAFEEDFSEDDLAGDEGFDEGEDFSDEDLAEGEDFSDEDLAEGEGFAGDELDDGEDIDFDDEDLAFEDDFESDDDALEEGFEDEIATDLSLNAEDNEEVGDAFEDEAFEDEVDEDLAFDSSAETQEDIDVSFDDSGSNQVQSLDYFSEVSGGAFSIKTSMRPRFKTDFIPETQQFVLTLMGSKIDKKLNRPFLTKDFKQSFESMNSYQDQKGDVRFVFKLKADAEVSPVVVTEEDGLIVKVANAANAYAANGAGESVKAFSSNEGSSSLDDLLLNKIKFVGRPISIQAKNEEIVNIINFISEDVGVNLIVSDTVKGTISLKLNQVPWDQALVVIMKSKGLGYVRNGNVLRIASIKELKEEAEAAEAVAKANKKFAPFHVKVFPLSYAKPATVEEKIKPFLTVSKDVGGQKGQVLSEERSSSLIIRDRLDVIQSVAKLIKELDQPPLQVMIKAKIVEANKNFEKELGSRFGVSFNSTQEGNGSVIAGSSTLSDTGFISGTLNVLGLDFFNSLSQTLRIGELESNLRVLSSPSVMAVNNEKAIILQSDEILTPQLFNQGAQVTTQPVVTFQRDPVELRLEVTPQVSSDGNVIMDLLVKRQVPGEQQQGTRPISTREAQTKVIVGNNKTAMIGGVYQTREVESKNGVPVLRKVPLIKWLFGKEIKEKANTELVIFITPKVVNAKGPLKVAEPSPDKKFDEEDFDEGFDEDFDEDFDDDFDEDFASIKSRKLSI